MGNFLFVPSFFVSLYFARELGRNGNELYFARLSLEL